MTLKYLPNLLPYSGAKVDLLDDIFKVIPDDYNHMTINDVFGGSGSFAINAKRKYPDALVRYNELDTNVFNTNESIQSTDPKLLYKRFKDVIEHYDLNEHNESGFEELKTVYNTMEPRQYWMNILLTRHAFSSLCRWNKSGEYNVKFGDRTWELNPLWNYTIHRTNELWNQIEMCNMSYDDFLDVVFDTDDNSYRQTVNYFDPPYLITDAVYNKGWDENSEKHLLDHIDYLVDNGQDFILSNVVEHRGRENTILKEWMKQYNVQYLDKQYNLSREGSDETKTKEVLVTNIELKENASLEEFL